MEYISLIGILVALTIIVIGSIRGLNLIILSSVATFIVLATGGVAVIDNYTTTYMGSVGESVTSLFPLFLGGQLFGKLLDKSGLTESLAINIVKKVGTKAIVTAVYIVSWVLVAAGVNVFVIIFTVYPLAVSFFKLAGIPRSLIPACVLGAAVSNQTLPGMTNNSNIVPTEALGVPATAGPVIGILGCILLAVMNLWYLNYAAKKAVAAGEGFKEREGENIQIDMAKTGMPNPLMVIPPLAVVFILLNVVRLPAYAALYCGAVVLLVMFFSRYGGIKGIFEALNDAAKGSTSVVSTSAIVGFASVVAVVPGYELIQTVLTKASSGNPYLYAAIAVAVIAGVSGSATGGIKFVLAEFSDKLLAMGANPSSLSRVMTMASLTFDSLPHNSAIVLTLNYCGVTHKEGYKHVFFTTVLATLVSAAMGIVLASMGIC